MAPTLARPRVQAPSVIAAVVAAITAASAVFMWAAYLTVVLSGISLAGFVLGGAVVTTLSALGTIFWYNVRQAVSVVDSKVDELHDDHRIVVAEIQAFRIEARRDHMRRLALVADDLDDDLASVTSLHDRRN